MGFPTLTGLPRFVLVSGILLGACSGEAIKAANGTGGSAASAGGGNDAGHAGSVGDAGSLDVDARNPSLPALPDDTCDRFQITQAACAAQCPAWPCDPATRAMALVPDDLWCKPYQAPDEVCAGAFNCDAANAAAGTFDLATCLYFFAPCAVDTDCREGYCVIHGNGATGTCESGGVGARCRADDDCKPRSLCIAVQADGKRGCTDGLEGSPCNIDGECQGKRCYHEPGSPLIGVCSTGMPGAPCFPDEPASCQASTHCVQAPLELTPIGGLCISGDVGDRCAKDSDCKSQHCPQGPFQNIVCTAGAVGDICSKSADCEDGFCAPSSDDRLNPNDLHCGTGEFGVSCLTGADCKSTFCDPPYEGAHYAHCNDRLGRTGEPCDANADCHNQVCGNNSVRMVCTNGQVGDECSEPVECASGFCVRLPPGPVVCSNGALNDYCERGADCSSQHCIQAPDQTFKVCGP